MHFRPAHVELYQKHNVLSHLKVLHTGLRERVVKKKHSVGLVSSSVFILFTI